MPPTVSVIVPTYNERDNVVPLVEALHTALEGLDWEAVYVDDDSPDRTFEEVARVGESDPRVRLVHRVGRKGLASAVIEGVEAAKAPVYVVIDGDLQHDPALIPVLVERLHRGDADLVVGSRFVPGGDAPGLRQARLYLSTGGIWLLGWMTGVRLADPLSGYFCGRRDQMLEVRHRLTGLGFKILLDLVMAHDRTLRVVEIPASLRDRAHGESKFGIDVVIEVFRSVWEHRKLRRLAARSDEA